MTDNSGELLITVCPGGHGWTLLGPATPALEFASGADAERSARRLAESLARTGRGVTVEIVLRDGRLGGRLHFGPAPRRDASASRLSLEHA